MSRGAALLRHFEAQAPAAIELLRDLVALDSPTADKAAVDRMAARVARELRDAGAQVTLVPQDGAGDVLRAVLAPAAPPDSGDTTVPSADPRPALLLGHLDTVWPAGEAARRPFALAEGCATGPGVYDMKAGIVLCVLLARAIRDGAVRPCGPVALFLSSDEETGSPCSRPHLETAARGSRYVLGLEPCNPDGGAKTARKGVGRILLEVTGVPAHAGIDPERGVNAIEELAAQILAIKLLEDAAAGISVHAGLVSGGVAKNVVAPAARAEFDVRVPDAAAWGRVETAVLSLRPRHPRARLSVRAALTHPPMVRTEAVAALLERARRAAAEVGFTLNEGGTGGGSDGSHCAALGVPVLDGLGVEGAGAHAADERIRFDRIAPRAAFLARLLEIPPGP